MQRLAGIYCALWTPTDGKGEVLWEAFDKHLSFVIASGVDGIMALGSTAEFPHLTLEQRKAVLERILAACKARGLGVIANVSGIQINDVVDLASHAKSGGADCISLLPPWFFPLEQRDLAEFFIEAARRSQAPVALYNFPEVTGKKIELSTIEQVAREANVIAVKQSGAEFAYHHDLLKLAARAEFSVMTGADTRLEEALGLGCSGTVSGLANAVPEVLCQIYHNFQAGKTSPEKTALINDLLKRIQPLQFPLNVKAAIEARGSETGVPKMPVSRETQAIYGRVVSGLKELFHAAALD